jgi:hypothetical protein
LADVVERRLMLHFHAGLTAATLEQVAALMVEAGLLSPDRETHEVADYRAQLATRYGRRLN